MFVKKTVSLLLTFIIINNYLASLKFVYIIAKNEVELTNIYVMDKTISHELLLLSICVMICIFSVCGHLTFVGVLKN